MRLALIPLAFLALALFAHSALSQPVPPSETTESGSPVESVEPALEADSAVGDTNGTSTTAPEEPPSGPPGGPPPGIPPGIPPGVLEGNPKDIPVDLIIDFFVNQTDRGKPSIDQNLEEPGKPFDDIGENFDILSRLIRFANLTETLTSLSNYTFFCPERRCFHTYSEGTGRTEGCLHWW